MHHRLMTRVIVSFALAFAFLLMLQNPAHATKFWKNSVTSGNWSTGNNWSAVSAAGVDNGGVPVASEPVRIVHTDGVARTVTLDTNPPALGLTAIDLTGAGVTTDTLLIPNNNSLTVGAIGIGGHNGVGETNGRGAVTQSNGTLTISSGVDLVVAWGAGSTGTYTQSGGSLVASQSEFIGNKGTGTFNQSGGTNTILANGIGSFFVGQLAGSNGAYNLSGTGQLISNTAEYIGNLGAGTFTQTGGTNTIQGAGNHLYLGNGAGGSGTYSITAGTLTANNDVNVGVAGTGTLNISGTGSVFVGNNLDINGTSNVNLSGGTLRLNTGSGLSRVNYTAGTVRLAGTRNLNNDPVISVLFAPADYSVNVGKTLEIEQVAEISGGSQFSVLGGTLRSFANGVGGGDFLVGENGTGTLQIAAGGATIANIFQIGSSVNAASAFNGTVKVSGSGSSLSTSRLKVGGKGNGTLNISGGATVATGTFAYVGGSTSSELGTGAVTLSGNGSAWTIGTSLLIGNFGTGVVSLGVGTTLDAAVGIAIESSGSINLNGGTLKFASLSGADRVNFSSGTIHAYGDHTLGTDTSLTPLFGTAPLITSGKNLTVAGLATLNTRTTIDGGVLTVGSLNSGGLVATGGKLDFIRGTLNITNQVLQITGAGALGGVIDLNDDATLNVQQGIENFGVLMGDGEVSGVFTNIGQLRAEPGKSLRLLSPATNSGRVNLVGGLLDFDQTLVNQTGGLVSGNGSLIVRNGLTNQGTMNFAGTANIVGDVANSVGGKIISGGGGATVFFDDVISNGEIRTSTNGFTVFYGSVSGAGTFTGTGTVNFEGDLTPGNSPATLTFGGDVAFGVGATLRMELGGTTPGSAYDQLQVADSLSLAGTLTVSLINGFNPTAGQSFNLFDWGSVSGTFDSLLLPTLAGGLAWNTSQLYTTGVLSVVGAGLAGDYNNNGVVDAADYVLWRENPTAYGGSPAGYDTWRANFGQTVGSGSGLSPGSAGTEVPEPAGCTSIVLAAAVLVSVCRLKACRLTFNG